MNGTTITDLHEIDRLFQAALSKAPDERALFLARQCQDHPTLRREVEELLAAAAAAGPLDCVMPQSVDFSSSLEAVALKNPSQLGRFKILGVIASGGMGTVYQAEQEQPRRTVAVKVMRGELTSEETLRRFECESQLLGRLRHRGIAQVYEAGVHEESGLCVPYFAMEFVPGARSICEYAASQELHIKQRLDLFARVCDAVEYGHRQGVMHRDLKPSNILVGEDGEPRVIDFGVARTTRAEITVASLCTETGRLVGTLQYMSPEQLASDSKAVDTQSDVYSLGVVLFELLSGQLPYDMNGTNFYEGVRTVIDHSPARLGDIDRRLKGELETIVATAMQKDRERRYRTAGMLGADIHRFLRGAAIAARPPSIFYQAHVFARRNKSAVAGAACVLLAVLTGVFSTSLALVKANKALDKSEQLTLDLSKTLSVMIGTISSVDMTAAEISYGDEPNTREVLDRIAGKLNKEGWGAENVLADADLRFKLGRAYRHLGEFSEAERHLLVALESRRDLLGVHPKVAQCLQELWPVYNEIGKPEKCTELVNLVIDWYESGELPKCESAGLAYQARGWTELVDCRFENSLQNHNRAIEMLSALQGPESRLIAWCIHSRALLHDKWNQRNKARRDHEDALQMRLNVFGPNHSHIVLSYTSLARNARARRELAAALEYAGLAWQRANQIPTINSGHSYYQDAAYVYGDVLAHLGRFKEAEPILRKAEEHCNHLDRSELVSVRSQLGITLFHLKKFDESEDVLLRNYSEVQGFGDAERTCRQLVSLYEAWGKARQATKWSEKLNALLVKRSAFCDVLSLPIGEPFLFLNL